MSISSQQLLFLTLGTLLIVAAVFDWRERRIPNKLILSGALVGLILQGISSMANGIMLGVSGFAVGFLLLLPGFLLRFTGAGDVKLLGTLGIYLGPVDVLKVFVGSVLIASVAVLLRRLSQVSVSDIAAHIGRYKAMLGGFVATGHWVYCPPTGDSILRVRVPMAPVFAVATAVILLPSLSSLGAG
ncbi:MAG: A24 family peptidase [Sedimenticolaceae bacterium]